MQKLEIKKYKTHYSSKTRLFGLNCWGDAKFGMSMKETLSTNAFKNGRKQHGVDEITMNFDQEFKFKKLFELNNLAGISAYYQEMN